MSIFKRKNDDVKRMKMSKGISKQSIITILLVLVFIPTVITIGMLAWNDRYYYIISMIIIFAALVPFFLLFEHRKPKTRELVLISVMTAFAVAGRAAFYMIPQFKPSVAIIIITSISLGSESGFAAGALTAFISNMFFGQGPWTPWQMFAMGLIGFISGFVFKRELETKKQLAGLIIYGAFITFFVYGGIMDTSSLFMMSSDISFKGLLAMFASGFVFNLLHALSTVFFLLVLAKPILKKLRRIKLKYGLMHK